MSSPFIVDNGYAVSSSRALTLLWLNSRNVAFGFLYNYFVGFLNERQSIRRVRILRVVVWDITCRLRVILDIG
jgi:hypothetical protein